MTRADILAAMERDVAEAMRRHLPDYFLAGGADAFLFLDHMATPLVGAARALALEGLRQEDGGTLPPERITQMVRDAVGRVLDPLLPEPAR